MNLIPRIFIFIFCLIYFSNAKEIELLNKSEISYLQNHKTLNIYIEPNIYFYTYTYGNYVSGYAIEYLKLLESKLNIKFNFISKLSKKQVKNKLKDGSLDLALYSSFGLEKNDDFLHSSLPIGILRPALLIPQRYQLSPSLKSIEKFKVAIKKDNELIPFIKEKYPNTQLELVDTISVAISKIKTQEVDFAIGIDEVFKSFINYNSQVNLKSIPINNNSTFPIAKILFTLSKDNNTLMNILNKYMQKLNYKELLFLRNQFFHSHLLRQTKIEPPLTNDKKLFLMNNQVLNVCVIPKDLPYGNILHDKYQGIGSDLVNLLEKNLDIPIQLIHTKSKKESLAKLKNKECDFLSLTTKFSENTNLHYSSTLFKVPIVLITNNNILFINDFNKVINESFIIKKDSPIIPFLHQKYSSIKLKEVNSELEGLKAIENNSSFGLITTLYSVSYLFRNHIPDNLKISAQLGISMPFNFAVMKDNNKLWSILEEDIDYSLRKNIQEILNSRVSKKYPKGFDYNIVLLLIILFIIFFIVMIRQHFILSIQKESLYILNTNLEARIEQAVSVNREKDILMFRQSRLASMGEMIGNIAHQWRQPLMELSAILMELQTHIYFKKEISNNEILKTIKSSNKVISFMSHTIDDFRNFFSTNKNKELFSINNVIKDSIEIMNSTLLHHKINIKVISNTKEVFAFGLKNEYAQVIISILLNAKDMLILREIKNGNIIIIIDEDEQFSKVSIIDNAGGIKEKDLSKIFEPFFTKKKINGSGIGLFISKMIIENNMKGTITANNFDDGAIFTILLNKMENENE